MRTSRTNLTARCPACLMHLDGATDGCGTAAPRAGDVSVCVYCSVVLQFNTDLTLRRLDDKHYEALPAHVKAQVAQYRSLVLLLMDRRLGQVKDKP